MQTIESEKLVKLLDVVGLLPYPVSGKTVYLWVKRGVRGRKLPTVRVGARYFVRPSDLESFIDSLNGGCTTEAVA